MVLKFENISKSFGDRQVLQDVNLTLPEGRIVGLLGKNGAGKSTLIKLVNDLLTPTSGAVTFGGFPIGVETKKRIAFLPERTYLDKSLTVEAVLRQFSEFYDNFDRAKAEQMLAALELDVTRKICKMSKGMQEKVQLVLVMARRADLYILDEPLGGVDPATRDYILDTILSNFCEGATVLISTHLISDVERILDDIVFIDKGRIVLSEPADTLRQREGGSIDEIFRRMFRC